MTFRGFGRVLRIVNPIMTNAEIKLIFQEAVEIAHQDLQHTFDTIWYPLYTGTEGISTYVSQSKTDLCNKVFYINRAMRTTQWTQPYKLRTFHTHVSICIIY